MPLAIAAIIVSLSACIAQSAAAQTVLRYSNFIPPGHVLRTKVFDPWIADVEKATAGRVRIEVLPKVVGTVAGQHDVVRDGLADVAVVVPSYSPGKFDLTEIVEIPFQGDRAELVSPAFFNFYVQHLLRFNEFQGTHVLSIFTNTPPSLYLAKRPVKSVDDFKGLKLRTSSASMAQSVTLLGGVPVIKPVTDIYEMVNGGLVDGALFPPVDHKSFKLAQLLPRMVEIPGGISCSAVALIINEGKWRSINPADRDAIMKVSGAHMARTAGKGYDDESRAATDELRKAGGAIEVLPAETVAELRKRLQPVEQAWIERARKKGLADPGAALAAMRAEIAASK
jgi:TRAP-type C4-dicarboxylate transport system substrate-binding protein